MAWLSGWSNRAKLTIDQTKVDADLTYFPLPIILSNASGINDVDFTSFFTLMGANKLKIAVTKDDGVTELYVEIDYWDNVNNKAVLWVSKSDWVISGTVDTDIYLYYDPTHADNSSYVGVTDSVVAQNVWETTARAVLHMNDDTTSLVKDSTSYNNDLIKRGAGEPATNSGGVMGDAQYFDGGNDYARIADAASIDLTEITCMLWIRPSRINVSWQGLLHKYTGTANNNTVYLELNLQNLNNYNTIATATNPINTINVWYHVIYTAKQAGNEQIYVNGAISREEANAFISTNNAYDFYVGAANPTAEWYQGRIDEFRVYSEQKPLAWCKTVYQSETDNVITYGSFEVAPVVSIPSTGVFPRFKLRKPVKVDAVLQGSITKQFLAQLKTTAQILREYRNLIEAVSVLRYSVSYKAYVTVQRQMLESVRLKTFVVDEALLARLAEEMEK